MFRRILPVVIGFLFAFFLMFLPAPVHNTVIAMAPQAVAAQLDTSQSATKDSVTASSTITQENHSHGILWWVIWAAFAALIIYLLVWGWNKSKNKVGTQKYDDTSSGKGKSKNSL